MDSTMKKFAFICAVCVSLMLLASCTINDRVVTKTFKVAINQNEWSYSNGDNNNYFYAEVAAPEITWDVYEKAQVMVYREYAPNTYDATMTPLPYTRYKEYYDESVQLWGFYSEHVDYEFTKGKIYFYYTASDFDYEVNEQFMPEAMNFHVVITYK